MIIETLVVLQTVFKQHYKADSKLEINESVLLFFKKKKQTPKKLSSVQLSRASLKQEELHCFPKVMQSSHKLVPNMSVHPHLSKHI